MPSHPDLTRRIAAVAALDQPLRRDLYRLLANASGWITRDDAAAALGIPRSVAAFHLDKLADAGVAEIRFQRLGGRSGPGAGRPSKLYRRERDEVAASVPDRQYDLAGSLLAAAIAESAATGVPVAECVHSAARAAGREIGQSGRDGDDRVPAAGERLAAIVSVLAPHGYEPVSASNDEIALANCPFHRLAQEQRELVCGMNLDFVDGVLEGAGLGDEFVARLEPAPGYCCVRIAPA